MRKDCPEYQTMKKEHNDFVREVNARTGRTLPLTSDEDKWIVISHDIIHDHVRSCKTCQSKAVQASDG